MEEAQAPGGAAVGKGHADSSMTALQEALARAEAAEAEAARQSLLRKQAEEKAAALQQVVGAQTKSTGQVASAPDQTAEQTQDKPGPVTNTPGVSSE